MVKRLQIRSSHYLIRQWKPNKVRWILKPKNNLQVEIKDLHFSYSEEKPAITGLDVSILPNQLSVFVGKSGCGKSTLVSLLMGFNKSATR